MEAKTFKAIQLQPDLSLKVDEVAIPEVKDNEVLVKMVAVPINPSDVIRTKGKHTFAGPLPYGVGWEGTGTVAQVGKNHTHRLKVGDRVSVLTDGGKYGAWAEYTLASGEKVFPLHPDNSFEEASSHFVNPVTVLLMLKEVQKEGHKAVVQSAAGSALGKMLIRVFKEAGIKTINLVRRDDVKEELLTLGGDYVLNTTDKDFETQLEEIAKKENATKFYDAVGGEFTLKVLRKLPFDSIISVYGLLEGEVIPVSIYDLFGGKTLNSFMLFTPYGKLSFEEKEKLAAYIQSNIKTTLKTKVAKTFSLENFKEAIEHSNKFGTEGKAIFQFE